MTTPLVILAVLSVVGGFIGIKTYYSDWSASVLHAINPLVSATPAEPATNVFIEMILPFAIVAFGIGSAYYLYRDAKTDPLEGGFFRVLANKFYFDEMYDNWIVGFQQYFARTLAWIDSYILEGLIIRGAAYVCVGFGEVLRLLQTGNLQAYAYLFTLGGIVLIYFTLFGH
jgi:NADH-quinone oxidoreductase subunit L